MFNTQSHNQEHLDQPSAMASHDIRAGENPFHFPPGTVRLESTVHPSGHIEPHPVPTDDPNDPLNWSPWRKHLNFGLAGLFVVVAFIQVSNVYVAYTPYAADLGLTYNQYNNCLAVNYAGLAFGSYFFMPFVHRYGRRPMYLVSLAILLADTIWAANMRTSKEPLPVSLVGGLGGSLSESLVALTIADLYFVHQHAVMNGWFLMLQATGTSLGPVMMGYVVEGKGWRFMHWLTTIFVGVALLGVVVLFEETLYIPRLEGVPPSQPHEIIVDKPVKPANDTTSKELSSFTNDEESSFKSCHAAPLAMKSSISLKTYRQRLAFAEPVKGPFLYHFYQPLLIFSTIPGVAYSAFTYGALLAWMSVMVSAQSYFTTLPPYNLGPETVGLLTLAPFIGTIIGSAIFPIVSDRSIIWLSKRNGGVYEPEMRLWPSIPGAFFCCAGELIFGLCLANRKPVLTLSAGLFIYTIGFAICADVALTYLLDSFHDILSDSLVAVALMRNLLSVIIMFTFTPWITGLGIRDTFIMVAVLATVSLLIPIAFLIWGKQWRRSGADKYRKYALTQVVRRES
ncbi:hypothetical protein PENSTE_c001G03975 [Penicillium steckii]|uniref:Major facilitator superfamily (MFS) profile domain-containing protein n=1 Tax=Penicillium steckii TaxID=303698 RepID=A0A1V6TZI8_9EURO|nr:hypothetical protein PENSTE_c001G03975 [Penicillium steckii]